MILRKPYAFLIKHFKLIHLLLCIPFVYLIIRFGAMSSFLSNYVRANYYTSEVNIAGTYINYFMYGAILLVILLALAIYFLMRKKEKDTSYANTKQRNSFKNFITYIFHSFIIFTCK